MRHTMRTVLACLVAVPLLALGLAAQTTDSAQALLRTAMDTAAVDGDLSVALEQYQTIVERFEADRAVVATALVQMADLYEKLGDGRFRDVYERVLRDYADQAEPVAVVRARLAALAVEPAPPSPTMTVRELIRSGERQPGEVSEPTNDRNFAISSNGQLFVYTDWITGDLATKNVATGAIRGLYGVSWQNDSIEDDSIEFFQDPVLSPDDKKVAYVRYPNRGGDTTRIEVDSVEGGHRETIYDANDIVNLFNRDWSTDGRYVLFSGEAADRSVYLAALSLEDKALQRLVTLDWEHPRRAEYSPDGHFIAYDSTKGGDRTIYLMSADGAQERVLVDSPGQNDSPLWTRDGRFLLFRSDRSGRWDLYGLRMQNGEPAGDEVLLKSNLGEATSLRGVTTEGQLYYFEQFGGRDVAIAERRDTTVRTEDIRILPKRQSPESRSPAFAPDGRRLAYLAGSSQSGRTIRITDLEGTIQTEIRLEPRFSTLWAPNFSPDGKKMALRVYDRGEPKIMVRSAETGALLSAFSPLEEEGYASPLGWSPDGRFLYVSMVAFETGGHALATIDVETEQVAEWTPFSQDVLGISLSPSGNYLGIRSSTGSPAGQDRGTQLVLRSLEDGSEKLLKGQIGPYEWDFDSRHLLYRKTEDDRRLYSFSIDTEEETVVVEDMKDFRLPSVSPDGKYWAFDTPPRDTRILVLENFLPESTEAVASR